MRRISLTRFSLLTRLALLLLLVTLPACGSGPTPLPATPTPAPTATPTIPPAPTTPPTSTPVPAAALTSPGPWILAEQSIRNYDDSSFDRHLFLMSEEGSQWSSLDLPPIDESTYHWVPLIAPAGGYIALLPVRNDRFPYIEKNDPAGSLYILKLPENRMVRAIPLLGEAGWSQVEKEKQDPTGPTLAGLVNNEWNFHWSPDGRYLAFPSAEVGSMSEVYLYDTVQDTVRPLARSDKHLIPWIWSPDGKTLLCQEIETYDIEYRMILATVSDVLQVSLDGSSKLLYTAESMETALWLDPERLLVYEISTEGSKRNIREVNITTGSIREVYPENFTGISPSPDPRTVLLNLSNNAYLTFQEPSGIYQVNLDTIQRRMLIPCVFCFIRSETKSPLIILELFWEGEEGIALYDSTGQEMKRFPKDFTGAVPSPDGKWLVVYGYNRTLILLDGTFEVVKEIPGDVEKGILWRSDSTGFYTEEAGSIVFYSQENGWQPAPLRDVEGGISWSVIQP